MTRLHGLYVGDRTGEGMSLRFEERRLLAREFIRRTDRPGQVSLN